MEKIQEYINGVRWCEPNQELKEGSKISLNNEYTRRYCPNFDMDKKFDSSQSKEQLMESANELWNIIENIPKSEFFVLPKSLDENI